MAHKLLHPEHPCSRAEFAFPGLTSSGSAPGGVPSPTLKLGSIPVSPSDPQEAKSPKKSGPFSRSLESKVRAHARWPRGHSLARDPLALAGSPPTPPPGPLPPPPRPRRTPGAADYSARRAGPARAADWACSAARRLAVASRKRSHQRGSGPAEAAAAAADWTERAGTAGEGCRPLAHREPAGERDPAAEPRRCPAPDFGARRGARRAEFRRRPRLQCK